MGAADEKLLFLALSTVLNRVIRNLFAKLTLPLHGLTSLRTNCFIPQKCHFIATLLFLTQMKANTPPWNKFEIEPGIYSIILLENQTLEYVSCLRGPIKKCLSLGLLIYSPPLPKYQLNWTHWYLGLTPCFDHFFYAQCFYQLLYFVLGRVQHLQWMGLHRVRRFQSSGPGCLWPGISWPGLAGCLWPVLSGAPSRQVAALGPSSRQPPIGQGN